MMSRALTYLVFLLITAATMGCFRGQPSDRPPIHPIPDMDSQPKYEAQEENRFFADSAAMRTPVAGTVARGELREDAAFYTGMTSAGRPVRDNPLEVTIQLLQRGQERFNIYCTPCHGRVGDGQGIMIKYGYVPPPTFHSERIRGLTDGEIFNTITNGIRNMPSYRHQVPVADRWAIVAYFRALQRSQNATLEDVPQEQRDKIVP